jgi:hypothetical protein
LSDLSRRIVVLIGAVGALLPLSAWLLVQGARYGHVAAIGGGSLLAITALFGLVALIRVVIVMERGRLGR